MTPANLIQALADELREATAQIRFPTEYARRAEPSDFVKVQVFKQYLPENLFEEQNYYPCICAELLKVEDDLSEFSKAEVALSCGVYAYEENAWLDLFHLMEVVRHRVLTKRVIANRFRIVNAEWGLIDEATQPRPFLFGQGILTYAIYQPQEGFRFS